MVAQFREYSAYGPEEFAYSLLPFRFARLDHDRYAAVNLVGETIVLKNGELELFVRRQLPSGTSTYRNLKAKHFLNDDGSSLPAELLALKLRTKRNHVADFTSLHMFVVTLRCNHSCQYCQVSRQSENRAMFDMTEEMADKALDFTFRSPSPAIKIEFQGGEPLLNFELIKYIVCGAQRRNEMARKTLAFVIATNLSRLEDSVLHFCREHDILISTSLDGPQDLHNANRSNSGSDSYQLAVQNINRAREVLGQDKVSALMTTTKASLPRAREIVDEYVRQSFNGIFLRSLSPYGFAIKTRSFSAYDQKEWLKFYFEGLDYILELNKNGLFFVEHYAAMILQQMITPHGHGFVNLQSPAGIGIAGIIFNYNGEVYPSDEARMKAEMGDKLFLMGHLLRNSYEEMMLSEQLVKTLEESLPESCPMCEDCAFLPFCGSDPDYHYATQGDVVGHKALSGFCTKSMGVIRYILRKMEDDPQARQIFESWVRW